MIYVPARGILNALLRGDVSLVFSTEMDILTVMIGPTRVRCPPPPSSPLFFIRFDICLFTEKYVGTACNQISGSSCDVTACDPVGVDCCPCDFYIDESECSSSTNECACKSGRYSNELGTNCIISKIPSVLIQYSNF